MENLFGKIAALIFCFSIVSCQFDGEYPIKTLAKISNGYYVVMDKNTPDYGLMIAYTLDSTNNGTDGETVASNCAGIYHNMDTIMYSISLKGRDTSYYVLPINPKREDGLRNDPVQVKEDFYQHNIPRFKSVDIPMEEK